MPVPKDVATWQPIARKLLFKKDQQQLPLSKVVRRLCRRGAKRFGLHESDEGLQKAVNAFVDVARITGSLEFSGNFVALPTAYADCTVTGQDGTASSRAGTKSGEHKNGIASVSYADNAGLQQSAVEVLPSRKRKAWKTVKNLSSETKAAGKQQYADEAPPAKKERSMIRERVPISENLTSSTAGVNNADSDTAGAQQNADEPPPARKRKSKKNRNALLSKDDTDEVNNADSMPGIPGSSNAEMTWKQLDKRTDVKRGRFSQSEKETLVDAIKDFARANNLSNTDFSWIYNTKNNLGNNLSAEDRAQRKGAWLAIAQSLPHRTPKSVYAFATRVLHEGNYLGKWSNEDSKRLLRLHAEKGNKWAEIGAALGRHPENTRYKFRELALGEAAVKGTWTPEDEAKLTELVTQYIEERPEPDIKSGRILIDAVNWDIISQQMGTRAPKACRQKWYDSLAPSMVSRGDWGIGDDRRLLKALFRAGYSTEWQVDWGNIVSERTPLAAKRRWRLMLKSVPDYQEKDFADIVDELVSAHLPALKQKAAQGTIADPQDKHTAKASDQPLKDTRADKRSSE